MVTSVCTLPRHDNVLPPGDVTLSFSMADRDKNDNGRIKKKRPTGNKCQFSSSAHKGQHSVYNFQDMYNLDNNVNIQKHYHGKKDIIFQCLEGLIGVFH